MAKRSKELFELLKDEQEEAGEELEKETTQTQTAPVRAAPPDRRGHPDEPLEPEDPATGEARAKKGGFGGRKILVSFNVLLFTIGSLVVVCISSFMVGKQMGAREEIPLSVKRDLYWAVQFTRFMDEKDMWTAWKLKNLLVEEGYTEATVLVLPELKKIHTVAAIFDFSEKEACKKAAAELRRKVPGILKKAGNVNRGIISVEPVKINFVKKESVKKEPREIPREE